MHREEVESRRVLRVMKLHTIEFCYQEICAGESPWVPLGNFMNDWYAYHVDHRTDLINDSNQVR